MNQESTEKLLDKISFDKLEPGVYADEGGLKRVRTRSKDMRLGAKKRAFSPETKSPSYSANDIEDLQASGMLVGESLKRELLREEELDRPQPRCRTEALAERSFGAPKMAVKPEDVRNLEKFLQLSYGDDSILVTNIGDALIGRKKVREIYFLKGDEIHHIWALEAQKDTGRELAIYALAYEEGIPTGKPIGFDLRAHTRQYPFGTAFLGGIVEHAGDSYDNFIEVLSLRSELVFETAQKIVGLISDMHAKLWKLRGKFDEYGVAITNAEPANEIDERLLPVLSKKPEEVRGLIEAVNQLGNAREGGRVVSHGDAHTRQFVTLNNGTSQSMVAVTNKYAVIDFGSVALDFPESDPVCFWTHQQRKALSCCSGYSYHLEDIMESYFGLSGKGFSLKNALIERALWDVYEMLDPQRKFREDIVEKLKFHYGHFKMMGKSLSNYGFGKLHQEIDEELKKVFKGTNYAGFVR